MTDWEKLKVAELKQECNARKISITGLKLKQQFVDKLVEYESNSQGATPAEESQSIAEKTNGAIEEVSKDEDPKSAEEQPDESNLEGGDSKLENDQPNKEQQEEQDMTENIPLATGADQNLPADGPAVLNADDSQASAVDPEAQAEQGESAAETIEEAKDIKQNDMPVPQPEQLDVAMVGDTEDEKHQDDDDAMEDAEEMLKEEVKDNKPTPTQIVDHAIDNSTESTPSTGEESRKRKRRSATPPVDAEEIQKKAKSSEGEAIITKRGARSPTPKPSQTKIDVEMTEPAPAPMDADSTQAEEIKQELAERRMLDLRANKEPVESIERPRPEDKDESVEPAVHAATQSLYLRNFKRPLNIQALKAHIVTIAKGSPSVGPDEDPIKCFNINNIRSHAFVAFSSISAASRVRAKMHGTRFPDEPLRDRLFVDFVPDDKVQGWVDQETSGNRGSRNSAAKLEVVYHTTDDGVEAVFREAGPFSKPQRPSIGATRSSFSQRQASFSADTAKTTAIAPGIHADRAGLGPQSSIERRRSSQQTLSPQKRTGQDQGIGFKGLDDLFDSTKTKPKLYYKLPPQNVVDERLDMIRDLYTDRGVTGDPGMKRYTFENDGGREGWVDNGPEFGHGRKGQDRLLGVGRGRGGFRGRGGGRGGFGGDSYRGGGRR